MISLSHKVADVAELKAELCSLEWLIRDLLPLQIELCFWLVCIKSVTADMPGMVSPSQTADVKSHKKLSVLFYDPTYVINEEMLLCNLSLLWQSNHYCCCDTRDASHSLLQKEVKTFRFPTISCIQWETLAISFSSLCLTPCVLPLVLCSSLTICPVGLFHCCGLC